MRHRNRYALALLSALTLAACRDDPTGPEFPDPGPIGENERPIRGTIVLPANAVVSLSNLEVLSPSHTSKVQADGMFAVVAPDNERPTLLFFGQEGDTANIALVAAIMPGYDQLVEVDPQSIASALVFTHPALVGAPESAREVVYNEHRERPEFSVLVARVEHTLGSTTELFSDTVLWRLGKEVLIAVAETNGSTSSQADVQSSNGARSTASLDENQ